MTPITQERPAPEATESVETPTPPTASVAEPTPDRPSNTNFESLAVAGFIFGLFAMIIAVFAVGLAARAVTEDGGGSAGGGGGGGAAPSSIDMTMADFLFDPDKATLATDGTINLTNNGSVQHDLVVEDKKSEMVDPGASATLAIDGLAPGDYTYFCSVPGHREAGMEGTLTVK